MYIVICSDCKEKDLGQLQTTLQERLNTQRQHIGQPEIQQIDAQGHIRICSSGNFKIMSFFQFGKTKKFSYESHIGHILLKHSNER